MRGLSPPLIALLLTALAVASYSGLAAAGFVWDDEPLIVHNTLTHSLANIPQFFAVDLWESSGEPVQSGYYRPLMLLSLAVDRALYGLSPAGHHLHSLLWHVFASLALLGLLRALGDPWAAVVGFSLFLLHPVQSEAVTWIAARNDLMAAAFVFAAVWALLPERPGRGRLLAGAALAAGAAFSKETGVLVLVLLLLLDLARWRRPRGPGRYGALGAGLLVWALARAAAGLSSVALPSSHWGLLLDRAPELIAHYTLRILWPHPLTVGHTLEYLEIPAPVVGIALLIAVVGTLALLWRGKGMALAGLLFAVAAVAPPVVAIALRGQLGERYLYLAMGGLALALASALPAGRRALLPLLTVPMAIGALSGRIPEWSSALDLWAAAVEDAPSPYTHASMAHELNRAAEQPGVSPGDVQRLRASASGLFQQALDDPQPYCDVCLHAVRTPLAAGLRGQAAAGAELSERACVPQNCGRIPEGLAGAQAMAWLQVGQWDRVAAHVGEWDGAPDPRMPLVAATLARHQGDGARYAELAASIGEPERLQAQIEQLLAISATPASR